MNLGGNEEQGGGFVLSGSLGWGSSIGMGRSRAGMAVSISKKVKDKEVLPGEDLTLLFLCDGHGEVSPGLCPLELFKGFCTLNQNPGTCFPVQSFTKILVILAIFILLLVQFVTRVITVHFSLMPPWFCSPDRDIIWHISKTQ